MEFKVQKMIFQGIMAYQRSRIGLCCFLSNKEERILWHSIGCLILTLLVSAAMAGDQPLSHDDKFHPFVQKDCDPKAVSQGEFRNGKSLTRIIQTKQMSEDSDEGPRVCRAWIEVIKTNQTGGDTAGVDAAQ